MSIMIHHFLFYCINIGLLTVSHALDLNTCISFLESNPTFLSINLEPRLTSKSLYFDYARLSTNYNLNVQFEFDILPVGNNGNISIMCLGLQSATVGTEVNGSQAVVMKVRTKKEVPVGVLGVDMACWISTGQFSQCRSTFQLTEELINTGMFLYSPFTEDFWISLRDEKIPYPEWIKLLELQTFYGSIPSAWVSHMNITSLTELFISGNVWERPEKIIGPLPNLFRLFLMNNSIEELPDDILLKVPQMKFLHLQLNKLTKLPHNMSSINSLETSSQKGKGPLKITDDEILTLHSMQTIILNTYLEANFSTFLKLPNLTNLVCHNCSLNNLSSNELPSGTKSSLSNLKLESNNITDLPIEIFRSLESLTTLNLDSNLIEVFPCGALSVLDNLKYLHLSKNRIRFVPAECFSRSNKLYLLNLSLNSITFIDGNAFKNAGNLLYLYIDHNSLVRMTQNALLPLEKLRYLYMSYNKLTDAPVLGENGLGFVGLAHNHLTRVTNLTNSVKYIQHLDLSGNHISELGIEKVIRLNLSYNSLSFIDNKMRRSLKNLTTVDLGGNNFDCCHGEISVLREFLNTSRRRIRNLGTLQPFTCVPKAGEARVILEAVLNDTLCYEESSNFSMEIGVPLGVLLVCLLVFFAARYYYKFQFSYVTYFLKIKKRKYLLQDEMQFSETVYDAFVCYSNKNFQWIVQQLIPTLENGPEKYRFCLHDRDFTVGAPIDKNIVESLQKSRKVILILTKDFLNSTWCQWEMNMANHRSFKEDRDYIIILEMDDLSHGELPSHLQHLINSRTHIKWPHDSGDRIKIQRCWQQLKFVLGDSIIKRTGKGPPKGTVLDL